jgi:uncharacterized repeat protein (TIGR03803 family)
MLYGTTSGGNTSGGTVFALNHDGSGYRVLRTFGTMGAEPRNLRGRLVEGPDGLLYGTAYQGGSNGFGAVFALSKEGTGFRVVWHFGADAIDGRNPVAGLTAGPDGVLYGNTEAGGGQNLGTFFRLDPRDVSLTIVHEGLNARVRWPVTGTADQLEQFAAWSNGKPSWVASGATVSSNAANHEANVPLSGTNYFLRVRRNWR